MNQVAEKTTFRAYDPNRAIRLARFAEYPKEVWYMVACFIFILTSWNILLRFANWRASTAIALVNDAEHQDAVKQRSSLREFPRASASLFRVILLRFTLPVTPTLRVNLAEIFITTGYLGALLTWEFINTRNIVTHRDLDISYWANRAGTIAASQLPLLVALSGKNNIISLLTGVSYEKLNIFHRAFGRINVLMIWIHMWGRWRTGLGNDLDELFLQLGIVGAVAASLALFLSIRLIRNAAYEFFLYTHIILVFIFLLSGYYHMQMSMEVGYYVWPAFMVWAMERSLRFIRVLVINWRWRSGSSDAIVELISEDSMRITVHRPLKWSPGQTAYLTMPGVSRMPFESHPFTIAGIDSPINNSSEPKSSARKLTFIVRSKNGFTKRLRMVAQKATPSMPLSVYVDGPYGVTPNVRAYKSIILVAGGSGVSFTLPLLMETVRLSRLYRTACKRLVFIWSVRELGHLEWIAEDLMNIVRSNTGEVTIDIRAHVTGANDLLPSIEKTPSRSSHGPDDSGDTLSLGSKEKLEETVSRLEALGGISILQGRPDIRQILSDEITSCRGALSVNVSGPQALSQSVRSALGMEIAGPVSVMRGHASVTLHVENFGL